MMRSKVLLLVGHDGLRLALSKFLRSINIEPIEASSHNEVYRNDISLVVANNELQREDFSVPAIILSNSDKPNHGNIHYFRKPCNVVELQQKINDLTLVAK